MDVWNRIKRSFSRFFDHYGQFISKTLLIIVLILCITTLLSSTLSDAICYAKPAGESSSKDIKEKHDLWPLTKPYTQKCIAQQTHELSDLTNADEYILEKTYSETKYYHHDQITKITISIGQTATTIFNSIITYYFTRSKLISMSHYYHVATAAPVSKLLNGEFHWTDTLPIAELVTKITIVTMEFFVVGRISKRNFCVIVGCMDFISGVLSTAVNFLPNNQDWINASVFLLLYSLCACYHGFVFAVYFSGATGWLCIGFFIISVFYFLRFSIFIMLLMQL